MVNIKEHWEHIYQSKNEDEVSWFQAYPAKSVALIELYHLPLDAPLLDVGGGDSHLVDALMDKGYSNIWVLDIAGHALERAKMRLGERARLVHWIESDLLDFKPPVRFELWHDRATFHFLTKEDEIARYMDTVNEGLSDSGHLIIAAFSEKGPEKCSELDVHQYSEKLLSDKFSPCFEQVLCTTESHITPFNTVQQFLFCTFKKKGK
jgi:hypothetical protein